jgi:hypothetical protein
LFARMNTSNGRTASTTVTVTVGGVRMADFTLH